MDDLEKLRSDRDAEIERRVRALVDASKHWWRWPLSLLFMIAASIVWTEVTGYPKTNAVMVVGVATLMGAVTFIRERRFVARAKLPSTPDEFFGVYRDHVHGRVVQLQTQLKALRVARVLTGVPAFLMLIGSAMLRFRSIAVTVVAAFILVIALVAVPVVARRLARQRSIMDVLAS